MRAGADAIGLVFYPASPRAVSPTQARAIADELPAFVTSVALFLDADAETVKKTIALLRPDMLQFHGTESAEFCRSFGKPYLKAVPMGGDTDVVHYVKPYADASGLLFDSHAAGAAGGAGIAFDWSRALPADGPPVILAGGLHAGNVAQAIARVRPYAVDVSSGVESAPGIKDDAGMLAFAEAVRRADIDSEFKQAARI